jgi:copper chaperone CopZ
MKYILFFSILFLAGTSALQGQTPATPASGSTIMTTKFKVLGNCAMCKKRIETAAKVDGVNTADWNMDTKMLTITFDRSKVMPSKVHQALVAVGHDTALMKADDKVYAQLHSCCQYDRE